ncbi:unnamed protein product [Urochloa decumbens]|uniref:Secreted protein n=1 Tax=Urochloa decumbens TaxID=240449 RepID=A0ABC8WF80_9POAL
MRSISTAVCAPFIFALLLLHCLACSAQRAPAAADRDDGSASRDGFRFQPRKLLRVAAAKSGGMQMLNSAAAAAAAGNKNRGVGVGASLKKKTPSNSNPKQN